MEAKNWLEGKQFWTRTKLTDVQADKVPFYELKFQPLQKSKTLFAWKTFQALKQLTQKESLDISVGETLALLLQPTSEKSDLTITIGAATGATTVSFKIGDSRIEHVKFEDPDDVIQPPIQAIAPTSLTPQPPSIRDLVVIAQNQNTDQEKLSDLSREKTAVVRYWVAQNPNTPPGILSILSNDSDSAVRNKAKENPNFPKPIPIVERKSEKERQPKFAVEGEKPVFNAENESHWLEIFVVGTIILLVIGFLLVRNSV